MANYPFKINIQFKDGSTKPHYTSSFATDAETSLSASAMVHKINLIPLGNAYTQDNEPVVMHASRKFGLADEGHKWISASYTHANTGSVIFTDTEDTDNGGLDFYTFWGTKVCNVLGLPEGIPIYTETFKLSDDSSNPSNYLSGDVIADGVAIKESFKMAPQGRMRSNLVWDHQFGEGFLQWVSGSASKLLFGYDDQADAFLLSSATLSTFNISGVTEIAASTGDFGKVETDTIVDDTVVFIAAGITEFDAANYTNGQLLMQTSGFNHMYGALSLNYTEGDAWDNESTFGDYGLTIENRGGSNAVNTFAGIAFDVGTEDDSDSIAGAIAVLRDNTTSTLHDGNMIFATNDAGDDGLTERLRITHDGKVGIGDGPCSTPSAHLEVSGSTIFNTGGDDFDFRVESVDYANMLFVNAATNQVSINSDLTTRPFEGDTDRDFKHDSPFTVFSTGELGGTTNDTVGMATFGYENSVSNGAYLEFFGRRNDTGTDWTTAGTRIQHVVDNVGQGYIEFNGEAGTYGLSLGTSASGTSVNAYITSSGIILDGDGHVTMPRQSAFLATKDASSTNVANPYTVTYDIEIYDQNSDFNTGTYTFTAPVTGKYFFGCTVRTAALDASATYYNLRIVTSNRTYNKLYDMAVIGVGDGHSSYYHSLETTGLADMDAGDTAYVDINRSGGAAQMDIYGNDTPQTRFWGYLVA